MKPAAPQSFGAQLKALREAAGFTQEELATIAGLSVHAVSALERGERRRPHMETVRALAAALDLAPAARDGLAASARAHTQHAAVDELSGASLPVMPTTLLGRDGEMQTLRGWLGDPTARLITLVGPGGAGKSRLALELAHTLAAEGATRVLFVPLAVITAPEFVAPAIAEALGLSHVSALDLATRVRGACDRDPTLLVLDNFEHVLAAAPLVADLLTSVAALRVLATSRAPLRLRGEREYAVGPLVLDVTADGMAPADLARAPAVRLFMERARGVQPDFRLTSANAHTVAAICRRLDALPLALELVAPWIKTLTADDLLSRLTDDVLLPTTARRDLPERQQTISATVAWSYQLLEAGEQRAFRRLGVLPARFPLDAAAAVLAEREGTETTSADALSAVSSLLDKSLLLRAEHPATSRPLYHMLETVRAYAGFELNAAGERDDALERLARYCTAEAKLAAAQLAGPAQAEWLDRVRADLENYRAALSWFIERGRAADACDIAWGLMFFWLIRGHAAEGLRWYEAALSLPQLPPDVESRALLGAAIMRYSQGELGAARSGASRALSLADQAGDPEMLAQAEHLLGHLDYAIGQMRTARDWFASSIERFHEVGSPWGAGYALTATAAAALAAGDHHEVEPLLDQAASALRRAGPWFFLLGVYVRAILAVRRGNADEAIGLARENLKRIRELHDTFAFVYTLVPLAAAAMLKDDAAWTARILGARDTVMERTGITLGDTQVQDLRQDAERKARARLGPERWARAYAAGRGASMDSLMSDLDRVLPPAKRSVRSNQ